MASYEELFGKKSSGSAGGGKWLKWDEEGETLLLEQTGEPVQADQLTADGKVKWLVQFSEGDRYKVVGEGTFDPDKVENSFKPNEKNIEIPVRVVGKKLKDGSKAEDFEPFDTTWETQKGNQREKLEEEMLETGYGANPGTLWAVKFLSKADKPYRYSVKIVKPAE